MPSGITPEFLEDLKSRCDIVRIAQKYMPVERKGSRFWARCPFHHEKTARSLFGALAVPVVCSLQR